MNGRFALLVALIWAGGVSVAQNGPYQPGKIDKADLEMAACAFDAGAPALKLVDRRLIRYEKSDNTLKMMAMRQSRIKILTDKGLDYANVNIPFLSQSGNERITKIEAYTYNLQQDGTVSTTKVDKRSIFTKTIAKGLSQVIIAFPKVKTGSVVEYCYTLERENLGYIEDWYFQDDIPVRYSEFEVNAPLLLKFREDPFIYMPVEKKEDLVEDRLLMDGSIRYMKVLQKKYVMRNLPSVQEEPFMTSKNDYRQRISFQLAQAEQGNGMIKDLRTNWEDVVKRLMDDADFGQELRKQIPDAAAVVNQVGADPDTLIRMAKIFNAVRNSMDWDGTYSLYALSGVRTAWGNKTGSSGDINTILINLLRKAGVKAEPLLVSTRSNGTVNVHYPSERQFNTLMAFVGIGNGFYVLDATDRYSAWQLIPPVACNTWGLRLLSGNNHQWVDLVPRHPYSQLTVVQAAIDTNGLMKGRASVTSHHYAKTARISSWAEGKESYIEQYIYPKAPGIGIDQLQLQHTEQDSLGLEQQLQFSLPLQKSGQYRYFPLNLFSGLHENPFTSDDRRSDIDFGWRQHFTLYGSYTIPDDYAFEPLSNNRSLIMPDTSIVFNCNLQVDDNLLRVRINVQFKQSSYLAQDYPAMQDFYKKMFAKLNEPVVIRKK
jgi:transglutaminase-like putative cysteine protease